MQIGHNHDSVMHPTPPAVDNPGEGVVDARGDLHAVQLLRNPAGPQSGVPAHPGVLPGRFDRYSETRPYGQWHRHELLNITQVVVDVPPGDMAQRGEMAPNAQPAVTVRPVTSCPWDTTRVGSTGGTRSVRP